MMLRWPTVNISLTPLQSRLYKSVRERPSWRDPVLVIRAFRNPERESNNLNLQTFTCELWIFHQLTSVRTCDIFIYIICIYLQHLVKKIPPNPKISKWRRLPNLVSIFPLQVVVASQPSWKCSCCVTLWLNVVSSSALLSASSSWQQVPHLLALNMADAPSHQNRVVKVTCWSRAPPGTWWSLSSGRVPSARLWSARVSPTTRRKPSKWWGIGALQPEQREERHAHQRVCQTCATMLWTAVPSTVFEEMPTTRY